MCAPRGALFSSSAVEWEEGCPFHLCSSVLQLLSCSTGASDQQSRRTKWDWFMAGPVFDQSSCGAGAEAFAVFLPGSFLWRASAPPLLLELEDTPSQEFLLRPKD